MERTIQYEHVDRYFSFLSKNNGSSSAHTSSPNHQLLNPHMFSPLGNHSFCIDGLVKPIGQKSSITITTAYKIEPNNSDLIPTDERDKSQTFQFTATIAMKVQYGALRITILLLEYHSRYLFILMVF